MNSSHTNNQDSVESNSTLYDEIEDMLTRPLVIIGVFCGIVILLLITCLCIGACIICRRCKNHRRNSVPHRDSDEDLSNPCTVSNMPSSDTVEAASMKKEGNVHSSCDVTSQLASQNSDSEASSRSNRTARRERMLPTLSIIVSKKQEIEMRSQRSPDESTRSKMRPPKPPPKAISLGSLVPPLDNKTTSPDDTVTSASTSGGSKETTAKLDLKTKYINSKPTATLRIPIHCYSEENLSSIIAPEPPLQPVTKPQPVPALTQAEMTKAKPPHKLLSKQPPKPPSKVPPPVSLPLASQAHLQSPANPAFRIDTKATGAVVETSRKTMDKESLERASSDIEASGQSNSSDDGYLRALYPCKIPLRPPMVDKSLTKPPTLTEAKQLPSTVQRFDCPGFSLAPSTSQIHSEEDPQYDEPLLPCPTTLRAQPLCSNPGAPNWPVTVHCYKNIGTSNRLKVEEAPHHYQALVNHLPIDENPSDDGSYMDMGGNAT